jgi:hypothetical protein
MRFVDCGLLQQPRLFGCEASGRKREKQNYQAHNSSRRSVFQGYRIAAPLQHDVNRSDYAVFIQKTEIVIAL